MYTIAPLLVLSPTTRLAYLKYKVVGDNTNNYKIFQFGKVVGDNTNNGAKKHTATSKLKLLPAAQITVAILMVIIAKKIR